jgi:hypothetical protein
MFSVGGNALIDVFELGAKAGGVRGYLVLFKETEPFTSSVVEDAVQILGLFAYIRWDFDLLVDFSGANMIKHICHVNSYSRLIGMIRNENCQKCVVLGNMLPKVVAMAVSGIVAALGVECEFSDVECAKYVIRYSV